MFQPQADHELSIDNTVWRIVPHPAAPGMPYGQEGRAAIVYQVCSSEHRHTQAARLLLPGGAVAEIPADGTAVTVGRGPDNDVVLSEAAVSREHGALVIKEGRVYVWDNSSRNGTTIEGKKIEPQKWVPVAPGSSLQLGTAEEGALLSLRPQASYCRALKAFKARFRVPRLVDLAARLERYATLPGLSVCTRTVLTPQNHRELLVAEPDLVYAVMMPWVEGRTWMEMIMERQLLSPEKALEAARSILHVFQQMEQRGLAHCDLSGPNVTVEQSSSGPLQVHLVDVEQLYGPNLLKPEDIFTGSPGYAHRNIGEAAWSAEADRFSGAILVCEMLAWCNPDMADAAWSESFFDPNEMQTSCERAKKMSQFLDDRWGPAVARLFDRAWASERLDQCPTFGEWDVAVPRPGQTIARTQPAAKKTASGMIMIPDQAVLTALMDQARRLEEARDVAGALKAYQQAQIAAGMDSATGRELALIVKELEDKLSVGVAAPSSPAVASPPSGASPHAANPPSGASPHAASPPSGASSHAANPASMASPHSANPASGASPPTAGPAPSPTPPAAPAGANSTPAKADPELLRRIRELEGAPGIAPAAPPPPPKKPSMMPGILVTLGLGFVLLLVIFVLRPEPEMKVNMVEPAGGAPLAGKVRVQVDNPSGKPIEKAIVFIDDKPVGEATPGSDGFYEYAFATPPTPGAHHLKISVRSQSGQERSANQVVQAAGAQAAAPGTGPEVKVRVSVTNAPEDLKAEDLQVEEAGVPQTGLQLAKVDQENSIVLLVENSNAVRSSLPGVVKASQAFLDSLDKKDRVSLVTFTERADRVADFGAPRAKAAKALAQLKASGNGYLFDALDLATALANSKAKSGASIVMFSAGLDQGSIHSLDQVKETLRRVPVVLYAVGVGPNIDRKMLTELAESTGGRVMFAADEAEMKKAADEIHRELRSQYTLSWKSSHPERDGKWRPLKVSINRPGAQVHAPAGFHAPEY